MKSYGQFCPIAKAAEVFCERWTALIFRNIAVGAHRFTEIHRGVPLMSASLLSQRLKSLEAEGLIERRRPEGAQHWTYHLTEPGTEFLPLVHALGVWGQRWTRRALAPGEVDWGLLVWGLEFQVDPTAFGQRRTTLQLTFTDQPEGKSQLWFVMEDGTLDLCLTDPGHPPDLWLSGTLLTLTYLYNGDLSLRTAIEDGTLAVDGPPRLIRHLSKWFNFSALSLVPAAVRAA